MAGQGVTRFIEVGPKDVLSKLVKRIQRDVVTMSMGNVAALGAVQ
jgi:malonyl CoA-acyl carrier protein transacylase